MRKRWKRAAAWLLIGILMIGAYGCGNGGNDNQGFGQNSLDSTEEGDMAVAKGRYVEALKETPEGVSAIEDMVRLGDGSVAFLNPASGDLHISKDNGDTWETKEVPVLASVISVETNEVTSMAIAPDGGIFFSYVEWGSEQGDKVTEFYHYIDKDGNDSEITLTDATGSYNFYLSQAKFTGERQLTGFMNGGMAYQIDLETKTITPMDLPDTVSVGEVTTSGLEKMFAAGDYIMSKEWLFQVSTQTAVDDTVLCDYIKEASQGGHSIAACFDSSDNTMYVAAADGLYGHVIGGSIMEKLIDGEMSNLGDPTKNVVSVLKNEDNSFLMAYDDGEIDLYTFDKDVPAVPTKQITVYSLNQNILVSKAVSMFRKSHPEVFVKQEVGISGDYGITEEDAIRNLNTKLLAGEGPDILLLDHMPMDSYIEKNMLADLEEIVGGLEQENNFFTNILRAYQTDKGLYAVPFRYQIPVLVGQKGKIESGQGMTSFAKTVKKAREELPNADTVMGTYTAEELLKRLYMVGSDSLLYLSGKDGVDPEKKLDKEAIKTYLEQANEIYQAEQKNITDEKLQSHLESITWQEENGMLENVENLRIDVGGIFEALTGNQSYVLGKLSGMTDLQLSLGSPDGQEEKGFDYEIFSSTEGKLFVPNGIIGMNEKTKEKELAVSFIKELLGIEVQKADLDNGFPVNADAFDKFTETLHPDASYGFSAAVISEDGQGSEPVHFSAKWPGEEAIAKLKKQIGELTIPTLSDGVVYSAVLENGIKVLEGNMSVDEGCDAIVQKIEIYLAE